MSSKTVGPRKGMQYLMAILAIVSAGLFTSVAIAADPVPFKGQNSGPVGAGDPRDFYRLQGGVQQPALAPAARAPAMPAAVTMGVPADVVVVTTTVRTKKQAVAKAAPKAPKAKSALQICREDLATAKGQAGKLAKALEQAETDQKAAEEKAEQFAENLKTVQSRARSFESQAAQSAKALSKTESELATAKEALDQSMAKGRVILSVIIALLIGLLIGLVAGWGRGRKNEDPPEPRRPAQPAEQRRPEQPEQHRPE